MADTCEACGKPLVWAITEKGKPAPINRAPSSDGNVLVFRVADAPEGQQVRCVTASAHVLPWLQEKGVPLRMSHFAYCPERDRFR